MKFYMLHKLLLIGSRLDNKMSCLICMALKTITASILQSTCTVVYSKRFCQLNEIAENSQIDFLFDSPCMIN